MRNRQVAKAIGIDSELYPASVRERLGNAAPQSLFAIGDAEILRRPAVGLLCSVKCPGSVVLKTFDAVRELRDAGIAVAGGFHSPMEQECLEFLLKGKQPVILCPAKHPGAGRMPATWREAIADGRLLLVSPFGESVRRTTQAQAQLRNEFVAALSAAAFVPHASPAGKVEATAKSVLSRGQPLFTFEDEGNASLIEQGASVYGAEAAVW